MAQEYLHQNLALFIAEHIRTIEQLELLLLTSLSSGQEWTAEAAYALLKTNRDSIGQRLEELVQSGLLIAVDGDVATYRFHPRNEQLAHLVSDLALAYKAAPVRVIETIYSPATTSLREFARAFRLKGEQ